MATVLAQAMSNESSGGTKPPFVRRVSIRGYKSIEFCDVYLQPLTILVGRNAAGKSNFLDALVFLKDVVGEGLSTAVKSHGGSDAIPFCGAKEPPVAITVETAFADEHHRFRWIARYVVAVDFSSRRQPRITAESLRLESPDGARWTEYHVRNSRVTWSGDSYVHPLTQWQFKDRTLLSAYASAHGANPFLALFEKLVAIRVYNLVPDAIRQLQKPLGALLERDGRNLASAIESLGEMDSPAMDRVRDYLGTIVDEVERLEVVRYGEFETARFWLRAAPGEPSVQLDAASMSDGTLRSLAALVAVFQIQPQGHPSVVGIEEPETSLHPAALRALVDALDDATQRTQILLTTHSPDILAGRDVHPGQVLVVRSRGGRTHITPLDRASREIIEKELYSLADLQRMDKLDLDDADLERQAQLREQGAN